MQKYRHTNTTVSLINYHFVFCPRYRRKIFLIDGLEDRFKEIVKEICARRNIEILALECDKDHCHLFVSCPPNISPASIMRTIKTNSAKYLLKEFDEFSKTKNLWTLNYFVSTAGNVSSKTIQKYVEEQKTRY